MQICYLIKSAQVMTELCGSQLSSSHFKFHCSVYPIPDHHNHFLTINHASPPRAIVTEDHGSPHRGVSNTKQEVEPEPRRLHGKQHLPSPRFWPTTLSTFRGTGSLQFHQRLPHALLCVGQIHMGEIHLERLQETGTEEEARGHLHVIK